MRCSNAKELLIRLGYYVVVKEKNIKTESYFKKDKQHQTESGRLVIGAGELSELKNAIFYFQAS